MKPKKPENDFGELMQHEINEINHAIQSFDTLRPGYLPTRQLGNVMRWLHMIPSTSEINKLSETLDPNSSGFIKYSDVLHALTSWWCSNPSQIEAEIWEAFMAFDKDAKGKIKPELLKEILGGTGLEPLADKEVKKAIRDFIDPRDGLIEYGVLIRTWMG